MEPLSKASCQVLGQYKSLSTCRTDGPAIGAKAEVTSAASWQSPEFWFGWRESAPPALPVSRLGPKWRVMCCSSKASCGNRASHRGKRHRYESTDCPFLRPGKLIQKKNLPLPRLAPLHMKCIRLRAERMRTAIIAGFWSSQQGGRWIATIAEIWSSQRGRERDIVGRCQKMACRKLAFVVHAAGRLTNEQESTFDR